MTLCPSDMHAAESFAHQGYLSDLFRSFRFTEVREFTLELMAYGIDNVQVHSQISTPISIIKKKKKA